MSRIITLGPSQQITGIISFNDAFEQVSEARGGRKKRQEKRKAKKQARKEKKLTRIADRNEIRSARQQGRAQRKSARMDSRTERAGKRQDRRTFKKEKRIQRRALGQDPILDAQEEDIENGRMEQAQEQYDYQPQDTMQDDTGYSEEQQGGEYESEYNEQGSEEQEQGTDADIDNEQQPDDWSNEQDPFEQEYEEDVYNFDSVVDGEDPSNEFSDGANEVKVPSGVQSIADKLEWNREYIVRLDAKANNILVKEPSADVSDLTTEIEIKKERINQLKDLIGKFLSFDGEFSPEGEYTEYTEATKPEQYSEVSGNRRKRQVNKALANAKRKRAKITLVKTSLNPIIRKNMIVVPPAEASSMIGPEATPDAPSTGLVGLDQQNDYDAPPKLEIELQSGFAGGASGISTTGVLLGLGLAAVAIWAIRKYKIVK